MDSAYFKEVVEEEARERLSLFATDGKKWWKVMPMGDLNSVSTFVEMMIKLQMEWDTLANESGLKFLHQK